ncbi:TetR/AcrR family transcriptional regulator [bacterium SCSIO 12696]|nr:TetR/AcrR family transcriptional regulator [bacterium SCSIO 12696]
MKSGINKEAQMAKDVLIAFAQRGFQKTSMEDIARAASLSRQSIYKKFGSKEKCYQWSIRTYLANMYTQIFATLGSSDDNSLSTLLNAFDISMGESIDVVSNPNGTEVMDDVLEETWASEEDWPLRYRSRLAEFLEQNNYAPGNRADGVAFALICSAKGLLLEESSREKFLEKMTLIIESITAQ